MALDVPVKLSFPDGGRERQPSFVGELEADSDS
jgi:hypothetical protein